MASSARLQQPLFPISWDSAVFCRQCPSLGPSLWLQPAWRQSSCWEMCWLSLCCSKLMEAPSQGSPAARLTPILRLNLIANCNKSSWNSSARGICVRVGTGRNPVGADSISHSPWELPWVQCHLAPKQCCSTKQCWASLSSGQIRDWAQIFPKHDSNPESLNTHNYQHSWKVMFCPVVPTKRSELWNHLLRSCCR